MSKREILRVRLIVIDTAGGVGDLFLEIYKG